MKRRRPLTVIHNRSVRLAGLIGLGTVLALPALSIRSQAQAEIPIYRGDPPAQAGIAIGSWGSGEVRSVADYTYTGSQSIKVTTHGRYQGARLVLASPIDLKSAMADKSAYLQFVYMLPDRQGAGRMGGELSGGGMGGGGMLGRPGGPGGLGRGGSGGLGGPTGPGGGGLGGGTTATLKPKAVANMRIVLAMADGKKTELLLPVENAHLEREEWKSLSIPVALIPGLNDSNGMLKEIQLFGDSAAILYLGQIRIFRDETPIHLDPLEDRTIPKNETQSLIGVAEGGPSPLKYEWTIQGVKARDGDPQEVTEAYKVVGEGRVFKHAFRRGGDYLVTLKVSDIYGVKKPVSTTMNIHVTL